MLKAVPKETTAAAPLKPAPGLENRDRGGRALRSPARHRLHLSCGFWASRRFAVVCRHSGRAVRRRAECLAVIRGRSVARSLRCFPRAMPRLRALRAIAAHHGFCDGKAALALRKLRKPLSRVTRISAILPWVETSTGSLGQRFSVALGMATGAESCRTARRQCIRALLGDGNELQEGEVWEAAMCAAHHKLDNLCAIIDYNKNCRAMPENDAIMRLEPLARRSGARSDWARGGDRWPRHPCAAHDAAPRTVHLHAIVPSVIIAHTVESKGVPYGKRAGLAWQVKLTREQTKKKALLALEMPRMRQIKEVCSG